MSHVVDAIYENGVLKLEHPLPLKEREKVHVTVESLTGARHIILDIQPVRLGKIRPPLEAHDELLDECSKGANDLRT
jgi:predicted DNA-binding antitoxin AbrB/MazE fold protein